MDVSEKKSFMSTLRSNAGFTLVEIAVSIAILGVALATIIGLQTNVMDAQQEENYLFRASLYAQYLMTITETARTLPPEGTEEGDLEEVLKQFGYFDTDDINDEEEDLNGWTYTRVITPVSVPPYDDALMRVDLTVRFSDYDRAAVTLVYFAKGEPMHRLAPQGAGALASGGA